jgi:biopolymer transport protein ExbB
MRRIIFAVLVAGLMMMSSNIHAADLTSEISSVQNEIEQYLNKLKEFRSEVSRERVELNNKISELQAEVVHLRKEDSYLQSFMLEKDLGFERVKDKERRLQEELRFIYTQTSEFRRSLPKRLSLAQELKFKHELENIDKLFDPSTSAGLLQSTEPLLSLLQKHLRDVQGGDIFQGFALDQEGQLREGQFIAFGPIEYFLSKDAKLSGLIGISSTQLRPEVVFFVSPDSIQAVISGELHDLPVDVTGGDAIKIEHKQTKSLWSEIKAGGVVMWPILGLFSVCLIVSLFKAVSLLQLNVKGGFKLGRVLTLINQNKIEEAIQRVDKMKRPLAPVLREGIEHRDAPKEHIEEIMHERILSQIPFLERGLPVLAVSAAAAPLLGLLGTVTGMMHTFDLVALFGTGKANLLSAGISEALITTKFGLVVAIPALIAHAIFARRVKVVIHMMEQTTMAFVNGLTLKSGNGKNGNHR